MIKAVIFDWFNTLARYEPPREEIHSRALKEFGIEIEPARLIQPLLVADKYFFEENTVSPIRKRSPEEKARVFTHYEEIILAEAGIEFDKELPARVFHKGDQLFAGNSEFVLFEDVLPTLQILEERKLVLGLLTNLAKDVALLCRKLGLEPFLDFIVTPEDAGTDKPHPPIFLAALAKAGVKAEEALYIGDQYKVDILGARGAGIAPIMIDRYNLSPEITDCPRIASLSELTGYLK